MMRFPFDCRRMCLVILGLFLLGKAAVAANPLDWCRDVMARLVGSPSASPQNPEGAGYPVLELAADVRKGVLRWHPSTGWAFLENAYKRKLDEVLVGPQGNRRVRMSTFDYREDDIVELNYVIRLDGTIVLGRENGPQIHDDFEGRVGNLPHSTLASDDGSIQRVQAAGRVKLKAGKIYAIDLQSGHYKPGPEALPVVEAAFRRYSDAFASDFRGVNFGSLP